MKSSHLYKNINKGYSLLRAYENDFVGSLDLSGDGLDLGAKSEDAKYYEYMDMSKVKDMVFVDYFHSGGSIIKMDLEEKFPIESNVYDFVLSFNVMEHIYNYRQYLEETNRVLTPGGRMHGFVPLMWQFHPDPNDYFRFTIQALQRLMEESGFVDAKVVPIAAGPFKVATSQVAHVVRIKVIRFVVQLVGVWLDDLLSRFSRGNNAYALAYYFTGVKKK